jgi:hypothetical protein
MDAKPHRENKNGWEARFRAAKNLPSPGGDVKQGRSGKGEGVGKQKTTEFRP